jgi:hypothetical protein
LVFGNKFYGSRVVVGPACEVLLESDDGATLDALDTVLASLANRIDRTRKGRVWDVWVRERPIHVQVVGSPPAVELSAGCNSPEDYAILREIAGRIVEVIGGMASEPEK